MTYKLYDDDAYIRSFTANVTSCEEKDGNFEVKLDKTAFFPEEGGQKCDSGKIGDAAVLSVILKDGDIIHRTDKAVSGEVECEIDFLPRLDKMRQHTGEHILSGAVHRLFGYDNVGFHLGDDDVTCDFNGPLTKEQLALAEDEANKAVLANLKVRGYYPDKAQLETLDYRSKSDIAGDVRIVEIEGADLCACCAPHVAYTGEVGIIRITEAASYKGGMRIHMACGERALANYRMISDNLAYISKTLSASPDNTAEYFRRFAEETNALKSALSAAKRELITLKAQTVTPCERVIVFEDALDMNALRQYVNALSGKYDTLCAVFSENGNGFAFTAASEKLNMRDVAKTLSAAFTARCGGSDKMIQGTVSADKTAIRKFFEEL